MVAQSKRGAAKRALLDLIDDLPAWHPIPPERALAEQLQVARMTLRHAIDDLVSEGALVRQAGRGALVAPSKVPYPTELTSFSEFMQQRGQSTSSRTVEFTENPAGAYLGRRLEISPRDPVVSAVRLRLAGDEPMALERLHVARARVPGLTGEDLEQHSFYGLLATRWGIQVASGSRSTEATCTDQEESEVLGVPLHTPAFLFERTTRDENGAVIEFVRSVYRGDRYRFVTEYGPGAANVAQTLVPIADR